MPGYPSIHPNHPVHQEPQAGVRAIAGAVTTEGKGHYAVRWVAETQLRGWTGDPSAGGVYGHRKLCGGRDQSPNANA